MKRGLMVLFAVAVCIPQIWGQLTQNGEFIKSNFKSNFLKNRAISMNKSTACAIDTLYYGRYNSTSHGFINLDPSMSQFGAGSYFAIDDTVMLHGTRFYAYSSGAVQTVTCKVYYANQGGTPAGIPIATQTYSLGTGFNLLPFMRQQLTFSSPVVLTQDFVISIEVANTSSPNIVFACNSWTDSNGLGNNYANVKFANGWSNNINVGGDPFDADFYFEPIVSYNMTARMEGGENSCLGDGENYDFINTTSFATNPQFSFEVIDSTLDDNFYWEYGDGFTDSILHGSHFYSAVTNYTVSMQGKFEQWIGGFCEDSTKLDIGPITLSAAFSYTTDGKLVSFKDNSTNAQEWSWKFGDGTFGSMLQNPKHLYNEYGTYSVTLVIRNNGCTDTTTIIVEVKEKDYTGINNISASLNLNISPNPAYDVLTLSLNKAADKKWSIFNLQGAEILNGKDSNNSFDIDISGLKKGVYFIKVESISEMITQRFVKL